MGRALPSGSGHFIQLATSEATRTIGAHSYSVGLAPFQGGLLSINSLGFEAKGVWLA